jgi:ABC-type uncharacterized transport system substrate-binding protein
MRRREFLALVAAAGLGALPANGQPRVIRRVGILMGSNPSDPQMQSRVATFTDGLRKLGWKPGTDVQVNVAWDGGNQERAIKNAKVFADASVDVIVANGTIGIIAARKATRSIPIVFAVVGNPVGRQFVESLAHPGGNATGFSAFEPEIVGKWIELLKEMAPNVKHISVLHFPGFDFLWRGAEAAAPKLVVQVTQASCKKPDEIRSSISALAGKPDTALIVLPVPFFAANRQLIIELAAAHGIPTIYPFRYYAKSGGLASYGIDAIDLYRRAAAYVDRILKGEKPADLPVQAPSKFEFVVNLKTSKALGLTLPSTLLARADEVIE